MILTSFWGKLREILQYGKYGHWMEIYTYCARYLIWILDGYMYILCEVFNMDIGWIYVHIVRGIESIL